MSTYSRPDLARMRLLCSAAILASSFPLATLAQEITVLDTIVVEGEEGEGLTEASTSISDDDIMMKSGGDVADAIRATPGAFTRTPSDNPGVSVNIRGMQGVGRVNTMIEGVPQTFRNMSGHAGSFDDQVFIDPSLLVGADISRGAVSGAAGLGALSGAANLRLIDVDDVLLEGKDTGGMVRVQAGDNGSTYNTLVSGAMRRENFSGVIALSGYEQGDYHGGTSGTVTLEGGTQDVEFDNADDTESERDADAQSGMVRLHFAPTDDTTFDILGLWGQTDFLANSSSGYYWETEKKLIKGDYRYNPSDLVDLEISAYLQKDNVYFPGSDDQSGSSFNGRDGTDTGLGVNITNTSHYDFGTAQLELSYGGVFQQDEFDGNAQSGGNASGTLKKYGLFVDSTFETGAFDLGLGLRYDGYKVSGVTEATVAGSGDCPADASDGRCIDSRASRSDGEVLPSISLGYRPMENLRIYASYAETMRAPTATEMFYPGGHSFSGSVSSASQNLDLEAEFSDTYEIGLTYEAAGVFTAGDSLSLSANVFRSEIENYVVYGFDPTGTAGGIWYNTDGTTTMDGIELSVGYENDLFYADLSFTKADTEQPLSLYAGIGNDVGRLPDDFGSLDVGVKLLDGDLVLGSRVRYVGDSVMAFFDEVNSWQVPSYVLVDLYGSYKVNDGLEVFANVTNVGDTLYFEANTGIGDLGTENFGQGREINVGATWRF